MEDIPVVGVLYISSLVGVSTHTGKTAFKLILIVDIYFDTSKCPLRGD